MLSTSGSRSIRSTRALTRTRRRVRRPRTRARRSPTPRRLPTRRRRRARTSPTRRPRRRPSPRTRGWRPSSCGAGGAAACCGARGRCGSCARWTPTPSPGNQEQHLNHRYNIYNICASQHTTHTDTNCALTYSFILATSDSVPSIYMHMAHVNNAIIQFDATTILQPQFFFPLPHLDA